VLALGGLVLKWNVNSSGIKAYIRFHSFGMLFFQLSYDFTVSAKDKNFDITLYLRLISVHLPNTENSVYRVFQIQNNLKIR